MKRVKKSGISKKAIIAIILLALAVLIVWLVQTDKVTAPTLFGFNKKETSIQEVSEPKTKSGFNKKLYSLENPTSIWVIVNKKNPLPTNYIPDDLAVPNVQLRLSPGQEQMKLRTKAKASLESMFAAAKKDGVILVFGSGYRSAALQKQFYDSYVARDGKAAADIYSARPGYSEHQTGLGVDITSPDGQCHLEICWEDTAEGKWVAANAYKYGFIVRYLEGKGSITGYQYEPWHLRYVGKDLAAQIKKSGQTLEEFFGLPPADSY